MDTIPTSYSGYLVKRGKIVKSWLRRYFSIERGVLSYSEDKGKKVKGQINIANATVESVPDEKFKRARCFIITASTGEVLIMQADAEVDREMWIKVISHVAKASLFKQGILSIQTGWRKRWKERFFVLSGPKLSWYESEANATAPGGSKPIASLVFSGKAAIGLTRITLHPPKMYTKGIDTDVLDRLIMIETNLDEATMALPWPPIDTNEEENGNTDNGEETGSNGEKGTDTTNAGTTTEDSNENLSSSSSSASKTKKINMSNCFLVLANTVEEAKEWQASFLTATTDPLQGDNTVTRVEDDDEEEQENDDEKTTGTASFSEDKPPNILSRVPSTDTNSITASTHASTVPTTASNPMVSVDDHYHRNDTHQPHDIQLPEPVENEQDKQQRLLLELQQHAKALLNSSSSSSTTSTDSPVSSSQMKGSSSALPANVQVPPGGKIIMVNGKPIIKPPKPEKNNTTNKSTQDGRAIGETSYESTLRVQDAKAKFGNTVASSVNGNNNTNTPNLHRRNSKDSMIDTLSVVKDEIEEQRLRQGDRSIYEAGGTGRRGDRRFDDRDDDLSVSEGYVKGVAGSLGLRKGEDNTPRGTGKRWTRNNNTITSNMNNDSNSTNENTDALNTSMISSESSSSPRYPSAYPDNLTGVASEAPEEDEFSKHNVNTDTIVNTNANDDEQSIEDNVSTVEETKPVASNHHHHHESTMEATVPSLPHVPDDTEGTDEVQHQGSHPHTQHSHSHHAQHPVSTDVRPHHPPHIDQPSSPRDTQTSRHHQNNSSLSPPDQPSQSVIEDNRSVAASSVFIPSPGTWNANAEAPERLHLRRRVYEYLLRRSTAATDPAQAAYLEHTLVPEIEEALYTACNGDREAYLDGATLKNRLKMVFAQRTANSNSTVSSEPVPTDTTSPSTVSVPATPVVDKSATATHDDSHHPPSTVTKENMEASVVFSPDNNNNTGTTNILASPQSPRSRVARHRQHNTIVPSEHTITEGTTEAVISSTTKQRTGKSRYHATDNPETNPNDDDENQSPPSPSYSATNLSSPVPRPSSSLVPQPSTPKQTPRWGNVPHPGDIPIRHYPALDPGGVLIKLVLERRADEPPPLPVLNKWQNRSCANCGITQTTGMFGVKATYCWYTELLFCPSCMNGKDGKTFLRPLPWRIVQELDDTPYPVSRSAAEYIDSVWEMPIIALTAVAPRTLSRNSNLRKIAALRGRIADLRETIVRRAAGMDYNGHTTNNSIVTPQKYNADDERYTANGANDDNTLLSEQLPPLKVIAESSPNAAAALAQCTNILRNTLGNGLFFMGEVPELLPLSLIVPAASTVGNSRIIPKLDITQKLLSELAEAIEGELTNNSTGNDNDGNGNQSTNSTRKSKKNSTGGSNGTNPHVTIHSPETKSRPPKDLYKDRSHLPPHLRYAGRTPGPNRQPPPPENDNEDDEEEGEYYDEEEGQDDDDEEGEYYGEEQDEEMEEEEKVVVSPSGRRGKVQPQEFSSSSSSTPRNTKTAIPSMNTSDKRTPSSTTKRSNPSSTKR